MSSNKYVTAPKNNNTKLFDYLIRYYLFGYILELHQTHFMHLNDSLIVLLLRDSSNSIPSPVPEPVGLVLKKGWKILSLIWMGSTFFFSPNDGELFKKPQPTLR